MIFEVLQVLAEEVNNYLEDSPVSLENIAMVDSESQDGGPGSASSEIILTLLNLQEEFALKNTAQRVVTGTNVTFKNPAVRLNLYVLFSANHLLYTESLKSISRVIEFFQSKHTFTQANSSFVREGDMLNVDDFRFNVHLYTPTFEELNFIWGTLGGKQYPSVLYKVSLIELERKDAATKQGSLITEIDNQLKNIE